MIRAGHYVVLLAVAAGMFLPNLGTPSLWDIDEGHNAEAAREMLESGNWIVPTFNFKLRVDKPALLYWLQIAAYQVFGVTEFAARLPSVLAAGLAMLVLYELGRYMFGAVAGLLAGIMLGSTIAFGGAAHFANPDALLNLFSLLTLTLFWIGYARGDVRWFTATGVSAGLAVLAKGPVGLVLPSAVIILFLLRERRLGLLWNGCVFLGVLVFLAVALPWYIWVSLDTKADFLRGFILTHNVNRFLSPMENHGGPLYYYLLVLLVGFAPWSAFLGMTLWSSVREWQASRAAPATSDRAAMHTFLWCWMAVYLVFFTVASTKLPNYILPLYPALALLTARCLDRWRTGELAVSAWTMRAGLFSLVLVGGVTVFALLLVGGSIPLRALGGRQLDGLSVWAALGAFPLAGAVVGWWFMERRRSLAVAGIATASVLFVAGLAGWGAPAIDAHKAPRPLGLALQEDLANQDVRVGCYEYYQPSLVFYCRREVVQFEAEEKVLDFLRWPIPVYLLLPEHRWSELKAAAQVPCRVLERHFDLYRGCAVVVVSNRPGHSP